MIRVQFARCQQTVTEEAKPLNFNFPVIRQLSRLVCLEELRGIEASPIRACGVSSRHISCMRAAGSADFLAIVWTENFNCAAHFVEARTNTFAPAFGQGVIDR